MKRLTSLLFLVFIINNCYSQKSESNSLISAKNYFEVNYPNYYYYYSLDKRFRPSIPLLNIGFHYKHFNSRGSGIQVGLASDYFSNLKEANVTGQIADRLVLYPRFGWHKSFLLKNKKSFISLEGDFVGRIGQITRFGHENSFEAVFNDYELLDVGLSIGSKCFFVIKEKVCFNIGLRHAFFIYVFDKGAPLYSIPSSPRNVTMLDLGIGFLKSKK